MVDFHQVHVKAPKKVEWPVRYLFPASLELFPGSHSKSLSWVGVFSLACRLFQEYWRTREGKP